MNDFNYAGFWWRWLAYSIDAIILILAGIVLSVLLSITLLIIGVDKNTLNILNFWFGFILGILINWLYFALMESSKWQATLGKRICKLTVTDTEGQRLSFGRASGRYVAKWISGLTCSIGYIMAAFTARKQALHDKIVHTIVLRKTDEPPTLQTPLENLIT